VVARGLAWHRGGLPDDQAPASGAGDAASTDVGSPVPEHRGGGAIGTSALAPPLARPKTSNRGSPRLEDSTWRNGSQQRPALRVPSQGGRASKRPLRR
jgi:hypothetical protein